MESKGSKWARTQRVFLTTVSIRIFSHSRAT